MGTSVFAEYYHLECHSMHWMDPQIPVPVDPYRRQSAAQQLSSLCAMYRTVGAVYLCGDAAAPDACNRADFLVQTM